VVEALLSRTTLPPSPEILDAGCGTGGNLRRYAKFGRVTGVDPSPEAVRLCREREREIASVEQAGIEELPFDDRSFDLIAATDVLEHVAAEREALRELWRVGRPDATLLLTVPAYDWLWSEEDERLHHKRRYTLPRLRSAAEECGWPPMIGTYFNSMLLPAIALARRMRREGAVAKAEVEQTPPSLDGPLSLPMRVEAKLIRAGISLPAGVSVAVVCRRAGRPS
jgi:SAM-dependent methyltransferase